MCRSTHLLRAYIEVFIQTYERRALNMNKWSPAFPSIISLCNDVQLNFDTSVMQPTTTTTMSSSSSQAQQVINGGGSTDVSILIQTHPSFLNCPSYAIDYDQSSQPSTTTYYNTPIEHETTVQTNNTGHEHFVSNEDLLQSLVAYADSFELDASVYSFENVKNQRNASPTTQARRRAQSTTGHLSSTFDIDPLVRHKSCDDLSSTFSVTSSSKPTTVVLREDHMSKKNMPQFVPSETHPQFFFATTTKDGGEIKNRQKTTKKDESVQVEECPTSTGGSNIEWGYSSDTMNELNRASTELFSNFEPTTDIREINLQYFQDLEQFSSMTASMHFPQEPTETTTLPPPPPVVIRKASRDLLMKQKVDIQLLQPPTPPPPGPIIIREVREKAPLSNHPIIVHEKLETNGQLHFSNTPSPIVFRERPPPRPANGSSSKPTILYRRLPAPAPPPPTVIFERLRSHGPTVIKKPAPILIEKWLPYPPEQKRQVIYERASPLPTSSTRKRRADGSVAGKKIIVEYDRLNVIVDKDIKQRKEIRRVSPNEYIKQYGNSLHSNESLSELLTNVTCSSQVKKEEHHYSNYTSVFR